MNNEIVKNNIRQKIIMERARREIETGKKVNLKDVFTDLAEFTGYTYENIAQLYKNNSRGSLYMALKLAKYFNCKVEDLYYLDDKE